VPVKKSLPGRARPSAKRASSVQSPPPRSFADVALSAGGTRHDLDVARLRPMLCDRSPIPLFRPRFFYELKLDGVRILAEKREARPNGASGPPCERLYYRSGKETTDAYPEVVDALRALPAKSVVLDGEIIAMDASGLPSFQRLQPRIMMHGAAAKAGARVEPVVFVAFDILAVEGVDVMSLPLTTRRALLEAVVPESGVVSRFPPVIGDGRALFEMCKARGMEGLVAKDPNASYVPGFRTSAWSKIRIERAGDFAVIGWSKGDVGGRSLRALSIASFEDGRFVYRGDVGAGMSGDDLRAFGDTLRALPVRKEPAAPGPSRDRERVFVEPRIVVRVRFLGVNEDGALRQPIFAGVRPDIAPEDCSLGE
jgi:bifunctional non-homologous end joining protein LigD